MNKRFLKRIVAFATAATLVLGNSIVAFADDNLVGQGTAEGPVAAAKYIQMTLPTATEDQFDYVADPNNLINQFASGGGANFDFSRITGVDTGLYFATRSGNTLMLSNSSSPLEVTNENYNDSDVSVEVSFKSTGTATFTSASSWTGGTVTAKELYLRAQADGNNISGTSYILPGTPAKLSFTVSGCPSNYTTDFTTKSSTTAAFGEVREYFTTPKAVLGAWATGGFHLEGGLNTAADWEGVEMTMPEIKVVWSISEHKNPLTVTPASMSTSAKSAQISGLASGVTFKSAKVIKADGSAVALTSGTQYTYSNDTFAIVTGKEVLLNATNYKKFVLTYSDGSTAEIPIVAGA